jgi:putative redox protein
MHAPRDTVVGIDNASKIFLAAKHPKSFVSLDDADPSFNRGRSGSLCGARDRGLGVEIHPPTVRLDRGNGGRRAM